MSGEENQQLLFNHINEQIVKNARVVEENERLETEIQQRAESAAPSTDSEDRVTTSTDVLREEHHELTRKYDKLSKKYEDLFQKVKYLERKNTAVMQKNKDMKDSVRAWQQYADRQKPNQKLKGATRLDEIPSRVLATPHDEAPPYMPSSPRSVGTVRTPLLRAIQGQSSPAPGVPLTNHEASHGATIYLEEEQSPSASVTPKGPIAMNNNAPQGAAHGRLQVESAGVPSSSQTTVDEHADQSNRRVEMFDMEDEDDMPQVVSERSLKRKWGQQSRTDAFTGRSSDGTPAKPHRVKDEPLSSPPTATHILMRTETIDLDDPAPDELEAARPPQPTPLMHSNTTGTARHQRSSSAPYSQHVKREHIQQSTKANDQVSNVHAKLQLAAAEIRALSEPMGPYSDHQQVLQSLDPNIITRTPERSPSKRVKQLGARRFEHGILAESGEALPPVDENELRLPPTVARARLNQRMRGIKNPQTPETRAQRDSTSGLSLVKQEYVTSPARTPRSVETPAGPSGLRRSTSDQRDGAVPNDRPVWNMRASEKRLSAQKSSTSPFVGQSRLRSKPIKELKVHDFKPNPTYNQGYTYAFSEAVRKRSDRLCLPGCTNPQCCGSTFRRLAEALDPLPAPQEEALLEEYLGDAYSTIICTQMSSDERAELVLQARTKKMAKDTGKHREAYERRRTPPGFWRVDFPTTQEQEHDRVRAQEQEIKTVQERWLETQKKGGKWIFRDE